jgi:hypothetical protein
MDKKVKIAKKEIDGEKILEVSLPGATDEELDAVFEKLSLQMDSLLPTGHMALGARILQFYEEGWPKDYTHEDCDDDLVDFDTGVLTISPTSLYDLQRFGYLDGPVDVDFEDAFRKWEAEKFGDPRRRDARYPYTYAYDLLRAKGPHQGISPRLSRDHARKLLEAMAEAMGVAKVTLCEILADSYLSKDEELLQEAMERAKEAWGME